MWYPAKTTSGPSDLPVSLNDAKRQVYAVDFTDDDAQIDVLIASAVAYIEKRCGTRFALQTVEVKCDCFGDFARLSEAPVKSIGSVLYVDTNGDQQTLSSSVYELRADDLEASIVTKYGQVWPTIQPGSRITVTADVGYESAPPDIKHAILLHVGEHYRNREPRAVDDWSTMDSLICNHIRGP